MDETTQARVAAALALQGWAEIGKGRTLAGLERFRTACRTAPTSIVGLRELARWVVQSIERRQPKPAATMLRPAIPPPASVILCSRDAADAEPAVARWQALLAGSEGEVIPVIAPPSLAAGLNEGIRRARHPTVILCHDDVEILSPDPVGRLTAHLEKADIVGIAGTTRLCGPSWTRAGWPHLRGQVIHRISTPDADVPFFSVSVYRPVRQRTDGIQALDGLLIAARRAVALEVGFDERTFDGFHLYDLDFCHRARMAGHRLSVVGDVHVLHGSSGNYADAWDEQAARFLRRHGGTLAPAMIATDTYLQADFATVAEALRFSTALSRLFPQPPER